jgi:hypothetical protein
MEESLSHFVRLSLPSLDCTAASLNDPSRVRLTSCLASFRLAELGSAAENVQRT